MLQRTPAVYTLFNGSTLQCIFSKLIPILLTDSMEPKGKRQRKANWGEDESLQLAIMYRDEVHALKSNFKHGVSNKKKHNIWATITAELNTQFHHGRTALEVKKRWFTISSKARTKLQKLREHHNGTGK